MSEPESQTPESQTAESQTPEPTAEAGIPGPRGGARTWYEVLDVQPGSSADDVKKAYDRALALVEGRAIGGYLMLDPLAAESAKADVESAWGVLGDDATRAVYDRQLGNDPLEHTPVPKSRDPLPPSSDQEQRDARAILGLVSGEGSAVAAPSGAEAKPDVQPADDDGVAAEERTAAMDVASTFPRVHTPLRFLTPVADEKTPLRREMTTTKLPAAKLPPAAPQVDLRIESPAAHAAHAAPSVLPPAPSRLGLRFEAPRLGGEVDAVHTLPPRDPKAVVSSLPAPAEPARDVTARDVTVGVGASLSSSESTLPIPADLSLDGDINGQLLRRLREARGMSLDDLASTTKIRRPFLLAIEDQDFENLPARVYLRGFLTQVARVLKVDRQRLSEGYLAFVDRYQKGP